MSDEQVYLNGQLVPAARAGVSVFDEGFLHGATVFTTMRAHNGKVFRLSEHLARLTDTAQLLGLHVETDAAALTEAVARVLSANALADARVRITLSPGAGDGVTTLVTAQPLTAYPAAWYERGIVTVVSSFRQWPGDPAYGHKTGCYLQRVLARQEAAAKGAEEALWYTGDNRLAEACFCNVFLVLKGKVLTPPLDTPVLPGIVRGAVIELCGRLGIGCDDTSPLTVREMLAAEEVFLTASLTGVRPVCRIERHDVGDGAPGEVTRRIMTEYQRLLEAQCPA
ncbi:MAG: aminotransferase class IV [Planctomycetota bacterium]|nr:aminotransferase class IV [Planctomycetota bacterium]